MGGWVDGWMGGWVEEVVEVVEMVEMVEMGRRIGWVGAGAGEEWGGGLAGGEDKKGMGMGRGIG